MLLEFADRARHPHVVADGHIHAEVVVVDEDALGGGGVSVLFAVRLLHEEAADAGHALVVGIHQRLDDDLLANDGADEAAALDVMDGCGAAAKTAVGDIKGPGVVLGHVVGIAVLVGDLVGIDANCACLAQLEVAVGQVEGRRTARGRHVLQAATGAIDADRAADNHRLAEGDIDNGVGRNVRFAVGRGGVDYRRRHVNAAAIGRGGRIARGRRTCREIGCVVVCVGATGAVANSGGGVS